MHVSSFVCNCILGAGGGVSVLPVMEPGTGWQPGMCSQLGRDIQLIHFLVSENGNAQLDNLNRVKVPRVRGAMFGEVRTSLGTFTIVTSTGQTLGDFHHKTVNHTGNQTMLNFPMHQFKAKMQVTKIILSEDTNRNANFLML